MVIETERLFLRELNIKDFDALYNVLADSDIMRHYPYTFDRKRVENWINKNIERYRELGFGLWAVCLKSTNEMIGDCGLTLQNIDGNICAEIGYHIAKTHQRNGYAKESAKAVRDWAFINTGYDEIYSYMTSDNIPSRKTAMSVGMEFVKEYISTDKTPISVYRITKAQWNSNKHTNKN